jgi:hypothetical protein
VPKQAVGLIAAIVMQLCCKQSAGVPATLPPQHMSLFAYLHSRVWVQNSIYPVLYTHTFLCSTHTGLEKENKYDKMRDMEHPGGANQRTSIEFRKHRQLADKGGPVGISYQIRPKAPEGKKRR